MSQNGHVFYIEFQDGWEIRQVRKHRYVRGLGVSPSKSFSTGSLQYVCRCSWQLALQHIAGAQSHLSNYITVFASSSSML